MRFRSFRSILDECVTAIQHGETLDACLARYPRHAARLKPLLGLAQKVRNTPPISPRPWAQATAWNTVRLRAADLRAGKRRAASIHMSIGWLKPLAVVFAFLLAVGATSGVTAFAAQDALPNETLYPVKLFTEDVRVWVTYDDSSKADILLDQSDERMDEIETLVSHGDRIPENVLAALQDRNEDALAILEDHPEETVLWARALKQSESQESVLIDLWDVVQPEARVEYTEVVADIHNARLRGTDAAVARIEAADLAGGIRTITGTVEAADGGVWTVGGYPINVDERTIGALGIAPGSTASFTVGNGSRGRYALFASLINTAAAPTDAFVVGKIEEVTKDRVRIGGQWIDLDSDILPKVPLRKGQTVQITVNKTNAGTIASQVSAFASSSLTFTYEGNIEGDPADSSEFWTIGGLTFTPSTRLDLTGGAAVDGARALVEATWSGGQLTAQSITVLNSTVPDGQAYLVGTFEGTRPGFWVVSGHEVAPRNNMEEPEPGSIVALDVTEDDGALTIKQFDVIRGPDDEPLSRFTGTAISIEGTIWNMEIGEVRVASGATEVSGRQVVGARAIVWYGPGDGVSQATYVHVLDQDPVVQPQATSADQQ